MIGVIYQFYYCCLFLCFIGWARSVSTATVLNYIFFLEVPCSWYCFVAICLLIFLDFVPALGLSPLCYSVASLVLLYSFKWFFAYALMVSVLFPLSLSLLFCTFISFLLIYKMLFANLTGLWFTDAILLLPCCPYLRRF